MIALRIYRVARWLHLHGVPLLPWLLKSLNRIAFTSTLPPGAAIAEGVILSYEGLGTVVHRRAVIGPRAVIGAGVTIGGRAGHAAVLEIGEGAMIGACAKILGPVKIGRFASIGANAVVLEDVPDFGVAVGVPARVVRIDDPERRPDYRMFQ